MPAEHMCDIRLCVSKQHCQVHCPGEHGLTCVKLVVHKCALTGVQVSMLMMSDMGNMHGSLRASLRSPGSRGSADAEDMGRPHAQKPTTFSPLDNLRSLLLSRWVLPSTA